MAITTSLFDQDDSRKPRQLDSTVGGKRPKKRKNLVVLDPLDVVTWPEIDRASPEEFSNIMTCLGRGRLKRGLEIIKRIRRGDPDGREARIRAHILRVEWDKALGLAQDEGEDPYRHFPSASPA
jgi:hypothetical protein